MELMSYWNWVVAEGTHEWLVAHEWLFSRFFFKFCVCMFKQSHFARTIAAFLWRLTCLWQNFHMFVCRICIYTGAIHAKKPHIHILIKTKQQRSAQKSPCARYSALILCKLAKTKCASRHFYILDHQHPAKLLGARAYQVTAIFWSKLVQNRSCWGQVLRKKNLRKKWEQERIITCFWAGLRELQTLVEYLIICTV